MISSDSEASVKDKLKLKFNQLVIGNNLETDEELQVYRDDDTEVCPLPNFQRQLCSADKKN